MSHHDYLFLVSLDIQQRRRRTLRISLEDMHSQVQLISMQKVHM